jgi:hypothetical protein
MPTLLGLSTPHGGARLKKMRLSSSSVVLALAAVALFVFPAVAEDSADLWRDAARAGALEPLRSPVAPLLLGASLTMRTDAERATRRGQLNYVETMLAFAAVGRLAQFKAIFGALPKYDPATSSAGDLDGYASVVALLRDADYDRWRQDNAGDDATLRDELLLGAKYFANAAVTLRQQFDADDGSGLADAEANLGSIAKSAGQTTQAVAAFRKAIAIYEAARIGEVALARVDAAFVTQLGGESGVTQGARAPAQYFTASAVQSLVPITIAIAGANEAQADLEAKDQSAAAAAIDLVAQANAQTDRVNQFLLATWPCQPQLAEVHYWRAQQNFLRWAYLASFQAPNAADKAKAVDDANHEFVAALAIALHASGPKAEDFTVKRDQYLSFLRATGKDAEAAATSRVVDALADSDVGGPTPDAWRTVLNCGAETN